MDEAFSDDAAHIAAYILPNAGFTGQLPPINDPIPNDPFNAYDPSLIDLTEFVRLRFSHQTKQATTAHRNTYSNPGTISGLENSDREAARTSALL